MFPELSGKRLLILGGSLWKKAIKDFAVENNITLVATGNDQSAGIFEIADEKYSVNSTDSESMRKLIKDAKIVGVYMGGSEPVIEAACVYLNELGLPCYCTHEQWEYLQNKSNFKELCICNGLPVVPRYSVENEVSNAVPLEEYPVITKPTDGCGSSGFSVCHNPDELKKGYEIATKESPTGSVIIEKFVPNDGVVVFYTVSEGRLIFSGLEDKYPVRYEKQGSYVGGLFTFESDLADTFRAFFEERIEKMIRSIGIKEGSFWIEVFHHKDEFYFNEVGFRYGGSASIYPVDYKHGINQVAADIYYALTGKSKTSGFTSLIPEKLPRKKYYAVYPIYCQEGNIQKVIGTDEAASMNNMVTFPVIHSVGSHIADTGSFSQVVALAHFVYDTEKELKETIEEVHKKVKFIGENNENMVIRMLKLDELRLKNVMKKGVNREI